MTISAPPPPAGILVSDLRKTYGNGSAAVTALRDGQRRVEPGEVVGQVGQTVFDGNHGLHPDLTRLRREQIGFIFPSPYLLPFLSVRDNVALLAMVLGRSNQEALLADEPTAPLDSPRAMAVMDLLERLAGPHGHGRDRGHPRREDPAWPAEDRCGAR
ncbi:hypothetical protein [Synechococcus sp. BA-132 BA5]|uniref:hypothetical protein n=1 Tax=Synechococcus sp. BA-132 BA5 TaxID=3110252 RepID=UPI002B1F89B6|nr:hypothetical protein [Synechococcus sp. BA-132 BA5]MEA5416658.1 hypothetical protein [Synechococcus sp. BA-132 BA5]